VSEFLIISKIKELSGYIVKIHRNCLTQETKLSLEEIISIFRRASNNT